MRRGVPGEAGSSVFGSITGGVFEGKIVSPKGSFYVEKAKHYFPHSSNQSFHSVIYDENHVEDPYKDRRQGKYYISTIQPCALFTKNLNILL